MALPTSVWGTYLEEILCSWSTWKTLARDMIMHNTEPAWRHERCLLHIGWYSCLLLHCCIRFPGFGLLSWTNNWVLGWVVKLDCRKQHCSSKLDDYQNALKTLFCCAHLFRHYVVNPVSHTCPWCSYCVVAVSAVIGMTLIVLGN